MEISKKQFPGITCEITPRAHALLVAECKRRTLTEIGVCTHSKVVSELIETYLARDGIEPVIEVPRKKRAPGRPRLSQFA
jgi:hypothetical protein